MSLESFSRLSHAIVNASEATSEEAKTKAQKDAALVVNSIGVMSTPKRTERPTAFSEATNFLGDAIKAAREAKLARVRETDAQKPETEKSLAELLAESAQDDE
jgi:Ca2+-dependent lipid-binding protein